MLGTNRKEEFLVCSPHLGCSNLSSTSDVQILVEFVYLHKHPPTHRRHSYYPQHFGCAIKNYMLESHIQAIC